MKKIKKGREVTAEMDNVKKRFSRIMVIGNKAGEPPIQFQIFQFEY